MAAALLFGVSAPAAKVLLSNAEPLILGAVLYLGDCSDDPPGEPHAHAHTALEHDHPHVPDVHHRHP